MPLWRSAANRGTSVPVSYPAALGLIPFQPPETGTVMFRIVLRPEEAALLSALRDGICPADEVPGSMLFSLMALRMLKCDEHGNPTLTDLAEAALERMSGKLHYGEILVCSDRVLGRICVWSVPTQISQIWIHPVEGSIGREQPK